MYGNFYVKDGDKQDFEVPCFKEKLQIGPIVFFSSAWNWFDLIIVVISIVALFFPQLPGVTVLRLFRAFRVFRLFKRIPSLKKIIEGVLSAIPGVTQAFAIMLILMGIWSVIGVEFFRVHQPNEF